MNQNNNRVTIKMIAEQSGLSIGTVDRALHNRGGVNDESRQHILTIAEELGYRPNKFASALGRKKEVRIGIIYPEKPKEFYDEISLGIDHAAEELQDYGVHVDKFQYPSYSPKDIDEFFSSIDITKYDGFAVNPTASIVTKSYINHFISNGKPTITFNTDAMNSSRLFYIGSNALLSGMIGAELLTTYLSLKSGHKTKKDILILGNLSNTAPFLERYLGFSEYIQMHAPNIQIHTCTDNYSFEIDPDKTVSKYLASYPDITGIYCTGYSSTVAAINALEKIKRDDIYMIGYDVTPTTATAIQDNTCNVLLHQYPFRQGHKAAHLLAKHLLEGWLPANPLLYLDTQIVLSSNVESYIGNNDLYLLK